MNKIGYKKEGEELTDNDAIPPWVFNTGKMKLKPGVDFLFDFGALLICKDKKPFREIRTIGEMKKAYIELTGEELTINL